MESRSCLLKKPKASEKNLCRICYVLLVFLLFFAFLFPNIGISAKKPQSLRLRLSASVLPVPLPPDQAEFIRKPAELTERERLSAYRGLKSARLDRPQSLLL